MLSSSFHFGAQRDALSFTPCTNAGPGEVSRAKSPGWFCPKDRNGSMVQHTLRSWFSVAPKEASIPPPIFTMIIIDDHPVLDENDAIFRCLSWGFIYSFEELSAGRTWERVSPPTGEWGNPRGTPGWTPFSERSPDPVASCFRFSLLFFHFASFPYCYNTDVVWQRQSRIKTGGPIGTFAGRDSFQSGGETIEGVKWWVWRDHVAFWIEIQTVTLLYFRWLDLKNLTFFFLMVGFGGEGSSSWTCLWSKEGPRGDCWEWMVSRSCWLTWWKNLCTIWHLWNLLYEASSWS